MSTVVTDRQGQALHVGQDVHLDFKGRAFNARVITLYPDTNRAQVFLSGLGSHLDVDGSALEIAAPESDDPPSGVVKTSTPVDTTDAVTTETAPEAAPVDVDHAGEPPATD